MKPVQHINKRTTIQICLDFTKQSDLQTSFHDTIGLNKQEYKEADKQVSGIEKIILHELFLLNPGKDYTVYDIQEWLLTKGIQCKESSLRSRINSLATLDKYKREGQSIIKVTGKRLNLKYSRFPNNTFGYDK